MSIQDIEARRAERKAKLAQAKEAQLCVDLDALDKAESEHGDARVFRVDVPCWEPTDPPTPTMVVVRMATTAEFKRWEETIARAKEGGTGKLDASKLLARSCILYPSERDAKESHDAMLRAAPGIYANVSVEIVQRAQGRAVEEGKDV